MNSEREVIGYFFRVIFMVQNGRTNFTKCAYYCAAPTVGASTATTFTTCLKCVS